MSSLPRDWSICVQLGQVLGLRVPGHVAVLAARQGQPRLIRAARLPPPDLAAASGAAVELTWLTADTVTAATVTAALRTADGAAVATLAHRNKAGLAQQ